MGVNRGLIQNDKYFTQFGQLRTMSRSLYGDSTETQVQTVPCLVYQEQNAERQTVPAVTQVIDHFACIASSWSVSEGDHLSAVIDKFGNSILVDARIVKITDYNSWRHGTRFVKLDLDLDLT